VPDVKMDRSRIEELYQISRSKYAKSIEKTKSEVKQQSDVIKTIEEFVEPII
jgi:hypothetical protein